MLKQKDAEDIFLEVIELQERNLGLNHPNTKVYCENLIELYDQTREVNKSIPIHEKIIKINEQNLGPKNSKTLNKKQNFAVILGQIENYNYAIQLLEEVLIIRKENVNNISDELSLPLLSSTLSALGKMYGLSKRFEDGILQLRESLEIRRKLLKEKRIPFKQFLMVLERIEDIHKLSGDKVKLIEVQKEIKDASSKYQD